MDFNAKSKIILIVKLNFSEIYKFLLKFKKLRAIIADGKVI